MGANRRLFKFPAKLRIPLRLATGIAVAGLAWQESTKPLSADSSLSSSSDKIKFAFDGVVRSSRAIYTVRSPPLSLSLSISLCFLLTIWSSSLQITFIVVDYKYSLRSLPPNSNEYRIKLSEVWIHFDSIGFSGTGSTSKWVIWHQIDKT